MSVRSLLDKNQKAVLSLLANSLFGVDQQFEKDVDWGIVWEESFFQGISSIAFASLDLSILEDESLKTEIKKMINAQIINTAAFFESHSALSNLLTDSDVSHAIIKGCASALYYKEPVLRAMGDVDFVVPLESFSEVNDLLKKHGFIKDEISHGSHDVFFDDKGYRYEMHYEPAGIPHGKPGEIIRSYLSDLVDSAVVSISDYGKMCVPDIFHHGLIILLHNAHHLTGEGIGLRQLCDWAVFINRLSEEKFMELFYEKLSACGLWKFARLQTALCIEYLGCDPKSIAEGFDESILENFMLDIFGGGNFGQKDSDRNHEALILSFHGKDGVGKKTNLSQFIQSVNDIVYRRWKVTKKHKILLPAGWLFFGGRYVLRSLIGMRPKIRLRQTVKETNKRKELYKQLKLYEMGDDNE